MCKNRRKSTSGLNLLKTNCSDDFERELLEDALLMKNDKYENDPYISQDERDVVVSKNSFQNHKSKNKNADIKLKKTSEVNLTTDSKIDFPAQKKTCESILSDDETVPKEVVNETKNEPSIEEDYFMIPELPSGKLMKIKIIDNWGDKKFVGLNGIEMFSSSGSRAQIETVRFDKII